jgi:hypothetical protein
VVEEYFQHNLKTIKVEHFPVSSSYLNAVEECWRQRKHDLLVSKYYPSFIDLKSPIAKYYRTRRLNLGIVKYLLRDN